MNEIMGVAARASKATLAPHRPFVIYPAMHCQLWFE
jgi:hypothetical protein